MNTENFKTWLAALRADDRKQGKARLATVHEDDTVSYCCMGLGCAVAEIEVTPSVEVTVDDIINESGEPVSWLLYGDVGSSDLPPAEFIEWLGLDVPGRVLLTDATYHMYLDGDGGQTRVSMTYTLDGYQIEGIPLAVLNDEWNLTFPQIADLIERFGVRAA